MSVLVVGGPRRFELRHADLPSWVPGITLHVSRDAPDAAMIYVARMPPPIPGLSASPEMLIVSPTAWAFACACNLADAYRPEGLP